MLRHHSRIFIKEASFSLAKAERINPYRAAKSRSMWVMIVAPTWCDGKKNAKVTSAILEIIIG
jgi:hypothetical protein